MHLATAGATLTVLLTGATLLGGATTGVWVSAALRAMVYLVAGLFTTAVLLKTHKRGPGASYGPIAALVLPMMVAGLDLFAMGLTTAHWLEAIAVAEPAQRQGLLQEILTITDRSRAGTAMSVLLALGLAALGPIASWQRNRAQAQTHLGAMAISVVTAAVSLMLVSNALAPLRPSTTFAASMTQPDAPAAAQVSQ